MTQVTLPSQKSVRDLNSLNNPPQHVKDVVQIVLLQFGYKLKEINEWGKNKQLLWTSYKEIQNFDYDQIDNAAFNIVAGFLRNPEYSSASLMTKSSAVAGFYDWLQAVNEYQGTAKVQKQKRRAAIEKL